MASNERTFLRAFLLHPQTRAPRTGVGWWAWLLQRVTGVALVGYLFLHIGTISTALGGEDTFDPVLKVLQTPPFVILDLGLLATVLYHTLNGFRVILMDLGIGIKVHGALFWASLTITLAVLGVATYFSVPLITR